MLAYLELIFEFDVPRLELAEDYGECHQLAHACRWHELVCRLLVEHEIGVGIHQKGVLGLRLESALRGRSRARRLSEAADACDNGTCRRELDPSAKA